MKFRWVEPLKIKRARTGGFTKVFSLKSHIALVTIFLVLGVVFWFLEGSDNKVPLPQAMGYIFLIGIAVSILVNIILWIFPATITVDKRGIHYQMGSSVFTDKWEDISNVRIEQRYGGRMIVYNVKAFTQKAWGITDKVSALELQNFAQSQQAVLDSLETD